MWEILFALVNIGIFLGYVFVAFFIAPNIQVELVRTKVGAIGFFITCGLTHLELALHTAYDADGFTVGDLTSWHMGIIHFPQVVFLWMFVTGLYQELIVLPAKRAADVEERGEGATAP